MVYDFVTRLQFATALDLGYDGPSRAALEALMLKSADITLAMQSATGEIPFGGRSNQFLHNETFYAAPRRCSASPSRSRASRPTKSTSRTPRPWQSSPDAVWTANGATPIVRNIAKKSFPPPMDVPLHHVRRIRRYGSRLCEPQRTLPSLRGARQKARHVVCADGPQPFLAVRRRIQV